MAKDLAKQTAKSAAETATAAVDNVKIAAETAVSRIDSLVDDLEESANKALEKVTTQAAATVGYSRLVGTESACLCKTYPIDRDSPSTLCLT